MFVDNREGARRYFLEVWRKLTERAPLSPLEALIAVEGGFSTVRPLLK